MRALPFVRSIAVLTLAALTAAGCAALSGLDNLEKVDCTDDCEAGTRDATSDVTIGDARSDTPSFADAGDSSEDASDDTQTDTNADSGADAPADSSADAPADSSADAPADAPREAAPDAAPDAPPPDSGCGATNTITNCGACGNVCNSTTSMGAPACNGTRCLYGTCNAGRADCNATVGADTDGCECATPGCCPSNMCQTTHDDGVGQAFYDCVARDTFNQTQATEACVAFTNNAGQCTSAGCLAPDGGAAGNVVCSTGSSTACICWMYSGPAPGHLYNSMMPGMTNCFCPADTNSISWH